MVLIGFCDLLMGVLKARRKRAKGNNGESRLIPCIMTVAFLGRWIFERTQIQKCEAFEEIQPNRIGLMWLGGAQLFIAQMAKPLIDASRVPPARQILQARV